MGIKIIKKTRTHIHHSDIQQRFKFLQIEAVTFVVLRLSLTEQSTAKTATDVSPNSITTAFGSVDALENSTMANSGFSASFNHWSSSTILEWL